MKMMKAYPLLFAVIIFGLSCKDETKLPDEANKPIPVTIARFDKDFFNIDTAQITADLHLLQAKYPDFLPGYLNAILGINPEDPLAPVAIKAFLQSYYGVYLTGNIVVNKHKNEWVAQTEDALKWMRYLVPAFKPDSPFVLTTFVGPMDAFEAFSIGDYGDVRTSNGAGIAMQLHLGQREEIYNQGLQSGIFYRYQVRRFEPDMVVVNTIKNVIEDQFSYTAGGKPLVEEMVEKGKRLYLLKKLLPAVNDSLLLGYSGDQLKGSIENEAVIWQFFVKNDLLFTIDPSINQGYIKDGPKTPELGEASPGYIGLFTGLQIVESFMEKYPETSIPVLMQKDPGQLFSESGYKPN
jgi:hypothetical protein